MVMYTARTVLLVIIMLYVVYVSELRSKYDGKSPSKASKKVTAEVRLRRKELKRRRAAQLAAGKYTG